MKTRLLTIVVAAAFACAAGCENNSVPVQDIHQEDTLTPDVPIDTLVPTDLNGTDTRPDTGNGDTVVPEDTNPGDVPVDANPGDVPVDVPADTTIIEVIPIDQGAETVIDIGTPVACTTNAECNADQFCKADACGGSGLCEPMPEMCLIPVIIIPVCACDGINYDSECFANMAGANVGTGADCGSSDSCTADGDCDAGEFCKKAGCADASGTCAIKPAMCPLIINPVCGCDGTTYNNSCLASSAGINVDTTGAACATATTCTADGDCASGFCYKTSCEASAEGTCMSVPAICLIIGDGVCGCDGNTYNNECLARKAHVSTDATGTACDAATTCASNDECGSNEYCAKATCDDAQGTCTAIPTTCKPIDDEVCGCDGAVYPNRCYAHRGRTNFEDIGNCTSLTTCTVNTDCGLKSKYCRHEGCATKGTCATKPFTCENATLQVCGCNDTTYKSICEAAKAGVSIERLGMCSPL